MALASAGAAGLYVVGTRLYQNVDPGGYGYAEYGHGDYGAENAALLDDTPTASL